MIMGTERRTFVGQLTAVDTAPTNNQLSNLSATLINVLIYDTAWYARFTGQQMFPTAPMADIEVALEHIVAFGAV